MTLNERFGIAIYRPCEKTVVALAREAARQHELIDYEFGSWAIESDNGFRPYLEVITPNWDRRRFYF